MNYLVYAEGQPTYPVCFLVSTIHRDDIHKAYLEPYNLNQNQVLVLDLHQKEGAKKTPSAEMKAYIQEELVPVWQDQGVEYIVCSDADYFKTLTKAAKAEANLGYVMDCVFGPWKVIYVPNYRSIFYDPDAVKAKIALGIQALHAHRAAVHVNPGENIIRQASYPKNLHEIRSALSQLLHYSGNLTADIETFSLKHPTAGIGTISFAWNQHEGIAFPVDYKPIIAATEAPYGIQETNLQVRALLREFFIEYHNQGRKLIWHNIGFDVYVLIYQLFMKDLLDTEGLLHGIEIMLGDGQWDCTKILTYLATNSCAGNKLGLKDQAQEFAGNYAVEEIKDITRIPLDTLLQYNLVDALSTWYVYNKHRPTVTADAQDDVYQNVFQPAMVDIIQMQLTGMPVNMERVKEIEPILLADEQASLNKIMSSSLVQEFTYHLNEIWVLNKNNKLKKKRVTLDDAKEEFNPNSGPQLQKLLYERLRLPVIAYTDSRQPATDGDTLKALRNHTQDPRIIDLLDGFIAYKLVNKIITDFLPSLKGAFLAPDGWHYLYGNFNLGGTVSGRLSSSKPNLQNLPANSYYAKLIKSCFQAPPGWIFVGLDFDSLEDRISALTTRDPNKLKVYTDGYDGHCLRAYSYFGDRMPDIDPTTVEGINAIAVKYKPERQKSKTPTFLLTYGGTYMGMMQQCGFDEAKAKVIEAKYHELYKVSDEWVAARLEEASQVGYVTVAFGLRLRTPLLKQVVLGNRKTPHEAKAEGRTAGNALGQSYCLLNSRAGSEFMVRVRRGRYRLDIKPCSQIHDAQYYLLRDDPQVVAYTNQHLVKAVQWQDDPAIWHPEVKLGGQLGIFYPDWTKEITIPNGADADEIIEVVSKALAKA